MMRIFYFNRSYVIFVAGYGIYFFGIKASFAEVPLGAGLKTLWISCVTCQDCVIVCD